MSHKSEMAGPFNRGDTIINKHFTYACRKVEVEIDCVLKLFQLIRISFQWGKRRIELSHIDIIKMIRKLIEF